ncbi:MAG: DUF523 and DUF1722 domain-containing protein [candidate division Zixibacteria bacterium]|nr:DUF523 and DUF1722 domain-containing protein [candidate division Zixibacteria bacterium]
MKQTEHITTINVGVSLCLLGENVRYDGGHKRDPFVADLLGEFFQFVPVCPEVELGMGVPREAVQLAGDTDRPRMIGRQTRRDWTVRMERFSRIRAGQLAQHNLAGYIFKAKSPSCGIQRVKVFKKPGHPADYKGVGLFAREIQHQYPLLPVEDEGRLHDIRIRENFITRVFAYHRFRNVFDGTYHRRDAVAFHTAQKYLILAHSAKHYTELGQLVANIKRYSPGEFRDRYCALFMEALAFKTTVKKNVNVLHHMVGFFKKHLDSGDKRYFLSVIDDYHRELVPLIVPITLIKQYVSKFNIDYLADQVYLTPHPKELMLRNHV